MSDCVAPAEPGSDQWREVWCDDSAAVASVTKVENTGQGIAGATAEADCPSGTDVALNSTDFLPAKPGGNPSFGYACARNRRAPHPGDPGQDGGPDIVEGDCVYPKGDTVEETRCDGKGGHKPAYQIFRITIAGLGCPPDADVQFSVGRAPLGAPLSGKAACAKKL